MPFKFPIPKLKTKSKPSDFIPSDLPTTDKVELVVGETIGCGTFGKVMLCRKGSEVLIVKEDFDNVNELKKKMFLKEVRLLNSLRHQNIVEFHSVVNNSDKCAFLMEYLSFDLRSFSIESKVSSLKELLVVLDSQGDCDGFQHFQVFF